MTTMTYDVWLDRVKEALKSINMPMEDWQKIWTFDFSGEHDNGTDPETAAMKANRFWWHQQNRSMGRDCDKLPGCWLPRGHQGECQPRYEPGDHIKVEFPDEATGIGEWMWCIVQSHDDERRLVYAVLDNEPLGDYQGKLKLASQLAISYDRVKEHRKASEFRAS